MFIKIGTLLLNQDHILAVHLDFNHRESFWVGSTEETKEFPCVRIVTRGQFAGIGSDGQVFNGHMGLVSYDFFGNDADVLRNWFGRHNSFVDTVVEVNDPHDPLDQWRSEMAEKAKQFDVQTAVNQDDTPF